MLRDRERKRVSTRMRFNKNKKEATYKTNNGEVIYKYKLFTNEVGIPMLVK
jgi:hypothetical protein